MRIVWRAGLVLAVFAGVAWLVTWAVIQHLARSGGPIAEVRLSGAAGGLFAGTLAAVLVGIALVWKR